MKRTSKKRRSKKTTERSSPKHIQVRYAEMEKPFGEETPQQTENVKKLGEWIEQRHAELLTDLDTLICQWNPLQMRGALKSNGISSSWPTKRIS